MPFRWVVSSALCILAACAFCACSKPQYIVPGLTLPPGATVVRRNERKTSQNSAVTPSLLAMPPNVLMTGFNCPGGWEAVSRHVDACMQREGYKDSAAEFGLEASDGAEDKNDGFTELGSVLKDPDAGSGDSMYPSLYKHKRFYEKQGSKQIVLLMAIDKAMPDSALSDADKAAWGDYALSIWYY